MALKIRMRQQGRKNKRVFRLVLTDSKAPRDGKYLEALGWYNPHESTDEKRISVQEDKIQEWLGKGAQLSDKARALLAKIAPGVVKALREKELQRKQKRTAKRRASRKKRAETRKNAPTQAKKTAPKASAKAPSKKAAPKAKATEAKAPKAAAKVEEKSEVKAEPKAEKAEASKEENKS